MCGADFSLWGGEEKGYKKSTRVEISLEGGKIILQHEICSTEENIRLSKQCSVKEHHFYSKILITDQINSEVTIWLNFRLGFFEINFYLFTLRWIDGRRMNTAEGHINNIVSNLEIEEIFESSIREKWVEVWLWLVHTYTIYFTLYIKKKCLFFSSRVTARNESKSW